MAWRAPNLRAIRKQLFCNMTWVHLGMSIVDLGSCSIEEFYTQMFPPDVYSDFRLVVHSNIMCGEHQIGINEIFPTRQTAVSLNRNIMPIYIIYATAYMMKVKNIVSLLLTDRR